MARILVIDDDPVTLALAEVLLERLGHEPVTAASGAEGIGRYLERGADLIITDIFMPRQDGLETLKRLRSLNPRAKVACMTCGPRALPEAAPMRDRMLEFALECGADGSIVKPLELEPLRTLVESLLIPVTPERAR